MRTWMPLISTVLYRGARKSSSLSSSSSADGDTPAWRQGPASPSLPKLKAPCITQHEDSQGSLNAGWALPWNPDTA